MNGMSLTEHQLHDILLFFPFFIGQLLYIMKRAGYSMRAGRAATRRAYLYQNWDILGFRAGLELIIYSVVRHVSVGQLLGFFHFSLGASTSFLNNPVNSPVALFALGIAA